MVTIRQCDLKRTVSLNDQSQTYFVVNDPQDAAAARAAALVTGAPVPEEKKAGGKIEVTHHHHRYRRAQSDVRLHGPPPEGQGGREIL